MKTQLGVKVGKNKLANIHIELKADQMVEGAIFQLSRVLKIGRCCDLKGHNRVRFIGLCEGNKTAHVEDA